jgi:hypothetical protein
VRVRLRVRGGHAIVEVEAPVGAEAPGRWAVRIAAARRIVETLCRGSLVLEDTRPSVRVGFPHVTP